MVRCWLKEVCLFYVLCSLLYRRSQGVSRCHTMCHKMWPASDTRSQVWHINKQAAECTKVRLLFNRLHTWYCWAAIGACVTELSLTDAVACGPLTLQTNAPGWHIYYQSKSILWRWGCTAARVGPDQMYQQVMGTQSALSTALVQGCTACIVAVGGKCRLHPDALQLFITIMYQFHTVLCGNGEAQPSSVQPVDMKSGSWQVPRVDQSAAIGCCVTCCLLVA